MMQIYYIDSASLCRTLFRYILVKIGAGRRGNPSWLPDCIINGQGQATAPTRKK
jgi:hypothetical protein